MVQIHACAVLVILSACASWWCSQCSAQIPPSSPEVQPVNYTHAGDLLQGYLSIPAVATPDFPVPAVVVIPDWDGVNEYEQLRATMYNYDMNLVGFAADIYGMDRRNVSDINERIALATFWRSNGTLFAERIQAAVDLVRTLPQVKADQIALAGYCFGGTGVLLYGLQGLNDVQAIVSFHGGLTGLPLPSTVVTPPLLVLSGGADDTSTDVIALETTLNSVNATWEITRYSDVEHAFTVFEDERYNERADWRSWKSTRTFLENVFGLQPYGTGSPPETVSVEAVPYTDVDGTPLQGYLAVPNSSSWIAPHPAVVILPDWDGVNQYEQQRASMLSDLGYVAFAADIFGADLQDNLDIATRINLTTAYRTNRTLFVQRIERAIAQVQTYDFVDSANVAVVGYCFGGTGIVNLAFSGFSQAKVVVSVHGGLTDLPNVTMEIAPYTLILSGGDDDAHGNQTVLEASLNNANATWEITRYSGVQHGFTAWNGGAYAPLADARSWESMYTVLLERMAAPEIAVDTEPGDGGGDGGGVVPNSDAPSSVPTAVPRTPSASAVPSVVPPPTTTSGGDGSGDGSGDGNTTSNGRPPTTSATSTSAAAKTRTTPATELLVSVGVAVVAMWATGW